MLVKDPHTAQRPRPRGLLLAAVATLSVLVSLAAFELGIRAAGYEPWVTPLGPSSEPTMHDPDPELGWWLRPGHWRYGPLLPGGNPIEVTIGPDRSRRTRPDTGAEPGPPRPQVLILGGSYTFCWAVSDDETWPWRMQTLRPDVDVRNRGTGAYSTLQVLLILERVLAAGEQPAHVIYAFDNDQIGRSVLYGPWLKVLAVSSRQNIVALPYSSLDAEGHVVRHPPVSYPMWPLRERSAAVTLLQDRWFDWQARTHRADATEVTRQLLLAMAERCRAAGIRFSLVLLMLEAHLRDATVPFAKAHDIEVIDCNRQITAEDRALGDFHPNARFLSGWGECVARESERHTTTIRPPPAG